jgi:hypothetical protein
VDGTAQHDAFAMKLDLPGVSVGARIMRIEADRKGKGVEPQIAARPGGSGPAYCCLTPHGFSSPRQDYVPGRCEDLSAGRFRNRLKRLVNPTSPPRMIDKTLARMIDETLRKLRESELFAG